MRDFEYYGDINSTHYSIIDRIKFINDTYGEGAYNKYSTVINNYKDIIEGLTQYTKPVRYDPIPNRELYKNQINTIRQAINGEGLPLIGFDTEVIGALQDNPTKESYLFAVTEVGFAELGENGVKPIDSMSMNLPLSVNSAKELDSKTSTIKNSAKRYFAGMDFKANALYEEASNKVTVDNRLNYYLNDKSAIPNETNITKAINEINRRGGVFEKTKESDLMNVRDKVIAMHDQLQNYVDNGYPIMGHNITKADIPWINELFKSSELSTIDFSKTQVIDTLDLINDTISYKLYDIYANEGLSSNEKMHSLESLKTLIDAQDKMSHLASNDIAINLELFNKKMPNSSKTLLDYIEDTLNKKPDVARRNGLLYSTKAIYNMDKSLSFLTDSNDIPQVYRSYATEKGSYYNIDYVKKITPNKYDKAIQENPEIKEYIKNKEGYILKLNQYTGSDNQGMFPTHSYIYANSIDEINNILSQHFIPAQKGISVDRNIEIKAKDTARRKFESFFEQTVSSFNDAKEYYSAFNILKEKGLNKNNIKELFENGSITINGKPISTKDIFYGNNSFMLNSDAKKRNFYYMYDSLDDTTEIVTPMIDNIEKGYKSEEGKHVKFNSIYSKEQLKKKIALEKYGKSLDQITDNSIKEELNKIANKEYWANVNISMGRALAVSFEEMSNKIVEQGGTPYILELANDNTDFMRAYGAIKINNDIRNINLSSKENAFKGLFNAIYSNKDYRLTQNTSLLREKEFNNLIKYLKSIDAISDKYDNTKDIYAALKNLSNELYEKKKENPKFLAPENIKTFGDRVLVNKEFTEGTAISEELSKAFGKDGISYSNFIKTFVNEDLKSFGTDISERAMNDISDVTNAFYYISKNYNPGSEYEFEVAKELLGAYSNIFDSLNYNYNERMQLAKTILTGKNSYVRRGYNVAFSGFYDNNGEHQYALIAFNDKDKEKTLRELKNREMPTKALIQVLPTIQEDLSNKDGGIRTIKTGGVRHLNSNYLNTYYDTEHNKWVIYEDDMITSAIKGGTKFSETIDQTVEKGDFESANRMIRKNINDAIFTASGTSAYQTVIDEYGKKTKEYIPKLIDMQQVINLDGALSFLYDVTDSKSSLYSQIVSDIGEEEFSKVRGFLAYKHNNKQPVAYEELRQKSGVFTEWLNKNTVEGANVLEHIANLLGATADSNNESITNKRVAESLLEITSAYHQSKAGRNVKVPNFIMPQSKFKSWSINLQDFHQAMPYTHLNPSRRPIKYQILNATPLLRKEIEQNLPNTDFNLSSFEDLKKYFENKKGGSALGIEIGDYVRTKRSDVNYFGPLNTKTDGFFLQSFAGVKNISSSEVYDEISKFESDSIDKLVSSLLSDQNFSGRDKYTTEQLYSIINDFVQQYKSSGLTYEQHSFLSPAMAETLYFKKDLKTIQADEENLNKILAKGKIENGDILQTYTLDGKIKHKKYKGDTRIIEDYNENNFKLFTSKENNELSNIKIFVGNAEKTVTNPILKSTVTGKKEGYIAQRLFESIFGENVGIVGLYGFTKHESGSSIIGSRLNITTQLILNNLGTDRNTEALNVFDMFKNVMGEEYAFELKNDRINKMPYISNVNPHDINSDTNIFDQLRTITKNLEEMSTDNSVARDILNTYKYFDENNLLYNPITMAPLHTEYKSSDGSGEFGNKESSRGFQVRGQHYFDIENSFDTSDGTYRRLAHESVEHDRRLAKNSPSYERGKFNLTALFEATKAQYNEGINPGTGDSAIKGKMVELNLSDILTASKDKTLNTQTVQDTIFGKYPDATVFKVNLGDMYVVNPFLQYNNARIAKGDDVNKISKALNGIVSEQDLTNVLYLGNSKQLIMDDNTLFMSESAKDVTALINRLIDYSEEGSYRKNKKGKVKQFEDLNASITKYYNSLLYELHNKNGIKEKVFNTVDLPFTMTALSTGIVEFNFTDDSKTKIKHNYSDKFIKVKDGKPIFSDVAFVSKEDIFNNNGLTREGLTKQILEEGLGNRDYKELIGTHKSLTDELLSRGYINNDKKLNIMSAQEWFNKNSSELGGLEKSEINKLYAQYYSKTKQELEKNISDYYVENIGIMGIDSRHPLFNSKGTSYVRHYGSDYLEKGSILYGEAEKTKKNGDVDGDTQATRFLLEEDAKGNVKVMNDNNPLVKEWRMAQDVQNAFNEIYYFDPNRKNDTKPDISVENYEKSFKERYPNAKNTTLDATPQDMNGAIESGFEKGNIGNISNINYMVREYNDSITYYNLNNNIANRKNLREIVKRARNINDFTAATEQRLIDTKHITEKSKTIAQRYGEVLGDMFSIDGIRKDPSETLGVLIDLLKESTVFEGSNKELITVQNVLSPLNKIPNLDEATKQSLDQLKSLYLLSQDSKMDEILSNPFQQNFNQNGIISTANMFEALDENIQYKGVEKANRNRQILEDIMDNSIIKGLSATDDVKDKFFVRNSNNNSIDLFKIKRISDNSQIGKHLSLYDYNKNKEVIYSGNTFGDIGNTLEKENFKLIDKEEFERLFNSSFKEQQINNDMLKILNNLDRSEKTAKALQYKIAEDFGNLNLFGETVNSKEFVQTRRYLESLNKKRNIRKKERFNTLAQLLGGNVSIVSDISNQISEIYNNKELSESTAHELVIQMNNEILRRAKNKENINTKDIYNSILKQHTDEMLKTNSLLKDYTKYKNTYSVNEISKAMNLNKSAIANIIYSDEKYKKLGKQTINEIANKEYSKRYKEIIQANEENIKNNTLLNYKKFKNSISEMGWENPLAQRVVGFGEYSNATLADLSVFELNKILQDDSHNYFDIKTENGNVKIDVSDMVNKSKQNIREFIQVVNYDKEIYNDISTIKEHNTGKNLIIDVNDLNLEIIKQAKEKMQPEQKTYEKAGEKIAKEIESEATDNIGKGLSRNNKIALRVAGGILGLAILSGTGNRQMHKDNTRDNNEQNDRNISKREKKKFFDAPNSTPTTYMDNGGVSINIKGKTKRGINTEDMTNNIGNAVSGATGQQVNLNINQRDDRENVDKNWLQKKFSSLMY